MENPNLILIVDDNLIGRMILEGLLTNRNYQLSFASNGSDALIEAVKLVPDLILLDSSLPDMDGFEACRRLRADSTLSNVPIVMITAIDDEESQFKGIEAGADDFVSKPFDEIEISTRVQTIIRLNRYRRLNEERTRFEKAYHTLQEAYDATIESWARSVEARDQELTGHTRRVTELSLQIARQFHLSKDELRHFRTGAILHDIGKMGIPDQILLKPGPLNQEEWAIMRLHPIYAHELLYAVPYLRPALDIPYSHHEKWDGTGYPQGLKGEKIPLAARIFAIPDVWDSLQSDLPYKKRWSTDRAISFIHEQTGKHFDPDVVEVFLKVLNENEHPS